MQLSSPSRSHLKLIFVSALAILSICWLVQKSKHTEPHPRGPFTTHQEKLWIFDALGVQYTHLVHFSDECQALANVSPQDYSLYQDNKAMHDELTTRYGPEIAQASPTISSVYISHVSAEVGLGVYARKNFKKGDFVGEYTGKVVKTTRDSTYTWSYPPGGGTVLGKQYSLDGGEQGNELRFANHSEDPNLEMKFVFQGTTWHVIYIACKEIKKGTQLLTNYGPNYWKYRNKVDL